MTISIGIINESAKTVSEKRVALTPEAIKSTLNKQKEDVVFLIEEGAGVASYNYDENYKEAGAKTVSRNEALKADILLFINIPNSDIIKSIKKGALVISFFNSDKNKDVVEELKKEGLQAVDINKLPRKLSNAQSMDALTSQSSVAGYKAAIKAATEFSRMFPMLTTAAGTIKPASVLVLGAGIAGLQAIATAKRLGAVVTAFDVRPEAEEEVLSLGARFLDLPSFVSSEEKQILSTINQQQGEGGLARKLTPEELAIQKKATDNAVGSFDILITTAQVPGSEPPQFVSAQGVQNMKPGSVIIDMAASEKGGNVEGSKPNQTVVIQHVKVVGAPDLASDAASSASALLAKNFLDIALHFTEKTDEGLTVSIKPEDELAKNMVVNFQAIEKTNEEKGEEK
ncbi:MAG: NAD(P) transhydrogenase subunit alpha [Candidatus Ancillula sp.]|jgi:NAD(P) transhydrogenase subunit alpha|nr:NAD(P) transhydrogenase subunit alpha [Candidatus Ancillula sp.]